jgi:hypothetical protein
MRANQLLNHVAFVIDDSGSMSRLRGQVEKVVANQIKHLADLDARTGQETHVSVYIFGNSVHCVIFDKDVKRLVGINVMEGHHDGGMTALLDATRTSQSDLAKTAQLYGDHAFLTFVLTDGGENHSMNRSPESMAALINGQPENWTLAVLVPDILCKKEALKCGFPKDNIMVWDVSAQGLAEAETEIAKATDSYYAGRSTGTRGSKTLFKGVDVQNVSAAQVALTNLVAVSPDKFMIVPVALASTSTLQYVIPKKSITRKNPNGIKHVEIQPFIQETGRTYVAGSTFYELTKSEKWDPHKKVALIHRQTKQVYTGQECKALLGLTPHSTRVRPQPVRGGDYDVFIQSTSVNRHLPIGTRVLILS